MSAFNTNLRAFVCTVSASLLLAANSALSTEANAENVTARGKVGSIVGTYDGTWTQGVSGGGTLEVVVETQADNGNGYDIGGYFDWRCEPLATCYGRELWTGVVSPLGIVSIEGYENVPNDDGLNNLGLGFYEATITDGTLFGVFGFLGSQPCANCTWTATLQPPAPLVSQGEIAPSNEVRVTQHQAGPYDPLKDTYIVTHGWQRFSEDIYDNGALPLGTQSVVTAIKSTADANVITLEWRGAFTGSTGVIEARANAVTAGALLGNQLLAIPGIVSTSGGIHVIGHSFGTVVNTYVTQILRDNGLNIPLFTILDAPTSVPLDSIFDAADLSDDWFAQRLDGEVEHVNNVYCSTVSCFGNDLYSAINTEVPDEVVDPSTAQVVGSDHSNVQSLHYVESIYADTWVNTFSNIPALPYLPYETPPLSFPFGAGFIQSDGVWIINGNEIGVIEDFSRYRGQDTGGASGYFELSIPNGTDALSFDYRFANGGDGDWVNFRIDDSHVLSLSGPDLQNTVWTNVTIDVDDLSGTTATLFVELVSVESPNAEFYMRDWSYVDYPDDDADGVSDIEDNCLDLANADQRDTDSDSLGNACDADLNNDCAINFEDLGLLKAAFFTTDATADFNGDGSVNFVDLGIMKESFFGTPGPSGLANACNSGD